MTAPLKPIELIQAKRAHLARLANQRGAAGEVQVLALREHWAPRPSKEGLKVLLNALSDTGIVISKSSFDAVDLPDAREFDFTDPSAVRACLPQMTFIEIKTSNQPRVKEGFAGFFFALTEREIAASDALGPQHRVALYNAITKELLMISVPEILGRAKSTTWQLSVQL